MNASPLNTLAGLIRRMGLAERIKLAMGEMTNGEFARACQVAPAAVTFWLSGDTKSLKAETAARMEKATGYRANWIVTGLGPRRVEDKADDAWPFQHITRDKIASLSAEQRARLEGRMEEVLANLETPKPKTFLIEGKRPVKTSTTRTKAG